MYEMVDHKFPAFVNLMERVRKEFPSIHGEVKEAHAEWAMNGSLDIQVTLLQDAPTEALQRLRPGQYTIHIVFKPYWGGALGPMGWMISDYGKFKGYIPAELDNDSYLKPHQTPYTWGFGEAYRERLKVRYGSFFSEIMITGYPDRKKWNGKRLLAGSNYEIIIAD